MSEVCARGREQSGWRLWAGVALALPVRVAMVLLAGLALERGIGLGTDTFVQGAVLVLFIAAAGLVQNALACQASGLFFARARG